MSEKIGTAVLELTTESGKMFRDLDELERRAGTLDKAWRDTGKSLQKFGQQTSDVGMSLTKLSLPIAAIGVGAAKAAVDFESSFAGVRKTVDATDDEFAQLSQGFRDLAKTIPVNVNELNRLGEAAGALGIPKSEIVDFSRVMALLGVTTNVTSDQAASSIAKIQNIFGAAGKDTEEFASTLVALGNDGASTESEILELANRIASAGHTVNLTQGQVLAFSSAIANVGIEAEAGGTAMSKTLIDISKAVSHGGQELASFAKVAGMSSNAFAKAFKTDAAEATRVFLEGLGKVQQSGGDLNIVIEGLFGTEVRQNNMLRSLALSGDNVTHALNLQAKAWQEHRALSDEAAERFKTVESQAKLLWNRLQDVAITFGNALVPAIKTAINIVGGLIPVLERAASGFAALPGAVQLSLVGLGGLLVAAGPLVFVLGQLITSVGVVTAGLWTLGNTIPVLAARLALMEATAGTLGLLLGGLAGVVAVVATGFAAFKIAGAISEWTGFTDVVGKLTARLGELVGLLPKGAASQYDAARAAAVAAEKAKAQVDALHQQSAAIQRVAEDASDFVGPHERLTGAVSQSEEELKKAKKAAEDYAKSLKALGGSDALAGAKEVVKQLHDLGGPLKVLPSKLGEMAERLREGAQAAMAMSNVKLADEYTTLAKSLDPVVQFQHRYNVKIGDFVYTNPSFVEAIHDQMTMFEKQVDVIEMGVIPNMLKLKGLWDRYKESVQQSKPFEKIWDGLADSVQNLGNTILDAVKGGGNVLQAVGSSLGKGLGEDFVYNFGSKITKHLGETLGGALNAVIPGVGALLGPLLGKIGGGLKKLFGIGVNEEVKKANAEIDKLRNELLDTYGPLDQLERKANAVGLSFEANWGHQGQAGLKAFQVLVDEFKKRWDALNASLQQAKDELGGVIDHARELGYEFNAAGELVGFNFQKMQDAAQRYGIDLAGLGPAFQSARLHASAMEIINDFTLLTKAGGDVGAVLAGMKDEINALVNDSVKFGVEIPANMKPWIEELIRSGQLTDDNGNKITDLTGIKFGEPVATEFEKITTKLTELIDKITELTAQITSAIGPAIDSVTRDRTMTVTAQYYDPGPPEGFGDPNRWHGAIPMAEGGMGRVTKPTLFLAGEAGPEDVAFSGGGRRFGSAPSTTDPGLRDDIRGLKNAFAHQTELLLSGFRDALAHFATS